MRVQGGVAITMLLLLLERREVHYAAYTTVATLALC